VKDGTATGELLHGASVSVISRAECETARELMTCDLAEPVSDSVKARYHRAEHSVAKLSYTALELTYS